LKLWIVGGVSVIGLLSGIAIFLNAEDSVCMSSEPISAGVCPSPYPDTVIGLSLFLIFLFILAFTLGYAFHGTPEAGQRIEPRNLWDRTESDHPQT